MSTTVLVTGATGFTGGGLSDELVRRGYEVRGLARNREKGKLLARRDIKPVIGNLLDRATLEPAMKGVDIVFHIGAMFRPENVTLGDMRAVNVGGTQNVMEAAIGNGVPRLVHCSTVGVLGDVQGPPGNESTPYAPGDHYQVSKMEGELLALEYMANGKLGITVCRPGPIYGPQDQRFLQVTRAINKRRFSMIGSGNPVFQFVYVEDLVNGMIRCGTLDWALGNIYILTGEQRPRLKDFFAAIASELGSRVPKWHIPYAPAYGAALCFEALYKPLGLHPPLYRRRLKFFRNQRIFDISKAKCELGFQPRVLLDEAVSRTIGWYRSENLL